MPDNYGGSIAVRPASALSSQPTLWANPLTMRTNPAALSLLLAADTLMSLIGSLLLC